ncbi:MarR Transcriptional regulators [Rhabdaerophilaceae bacterium]
MAEDDKLIKYGMLDRRIGYVLRRAQIAVFQDFFQTVSTFDVSPAQYSVLTVVECNPGLSQTQVADSLGIKKTNFVPMIKSLETRGLVERRETPSDKRSFALYLTASGTTLIEALHAASDEHEERICETIGKRRYHDLFVPLCEIAKLGQRPQATPNKD